ncbi:MAG: tetratricopeptide repeat protein [Gemmatimonadales bacterium]|nr:tetratricopeptide repeat protein [Gemmatimonadales bacterium]
MSHRTLTGVRIPALLLSFLVLAPASLAAQAAPAPGPTKLELTHVPAAARTAFQAGVLDLANVFIARGITNLEEALRLDPTFGLARVFWAMQAPMDAAARTAELDRGVADAAKGSVGEATFAMALRANRLGRRAEAQHLFKTARELLPADPIVANYAAPVSAGSVEELTMAYRQLTVDFPTWAAPFNNLAYNLSRAGDRAGALAMVKKYMELAPNHPNSHDSYAEMLQFEGRLDEAVAHYRRALAIDPDYAAGYTGIADARQLQGRGADARAALTEGLAHAPTPVAKASLHRLVALSFAADGNLRGAETALGEAMKEATAANVTPLTANLHRDFAMVNAVTGNANGVAGHLNAAGAPNPNLAGQNAMVLAVAGRNAEARAALDAASGMPNATQALYLTRNGPVIRALLLVNEGQGEAALAELAKGDITLPTAEAVAALAEHQRRNATMARLFRDRVMSNPAYTLANTELAIARALAARVR